MFDDIIRDNLSPEPSKESYGERLNYMNALLGLKNECQKFEYCNPKCVFYNKHEATCYLRAYPCDYELSEIEKAVSKIIDTEMNKI